MKKKLWSKKAWVLNNLILLFPLRPLWFFIPFILSVSFTLQSMLQFHNDTWWLWLLRGRRRRWRTKNEEDGYERGWTNGIKESDKSLFWLLFPLFSHSVQILEFNVPKFSLPQRQDLLLIPKYFMSLQVLVNCVYLLQNSHVNSSKYFE